MIGEPVSNLAELVGYALILAFLYFVWPPLVLLGAGVLLVFWANVRRSDGKTAAAVGAAWAAARHAYQTQRGTPELRRVA